MRGGIHRYAGGTRCCHFDRPLISSNHTLYSGCRLTSTSHHTPSPPTPSLPHTTTSSPPHSSYPPSSLPPCPQHQRTKWGPLRGSWCRGCERGRRRRPEWGRRGVRLSCLRYGIGRFSLVNGGVEGFEGRPTWFDVGNDLDPSFMESLHHLLKIWVPFRVHIESVSIAFRTCGVSR